MKTHILIVRPYAFLLFTYLLNSSFHGEIVYCLWFWTYLLRINFSVRMPNVIPLYNMFSLYINLFHTYNLTDVSWPLATLHL